MHPVMFGPYRLEAQLSHSATATVYHATDVGHRDRVVALKVFSPALSADPGFRHRFRVDAALLSALREPHVVPVNGYGEIDGLAYLDMRLVPGPSLADVLRSGPLHPVHAHAVAQQVRVAVESLLRGGLGHRPLQPADVLLTGPPGRESVQLVGLGIGRPPVPPEAVPPPEALLAPTRGWRPPRTRWRARLAAAAVAAVSVVALLVAVRVGAGGDGADVGAPGPPAGPPGLIATMPLPPEKITSAGFAEFGRRPVIVASTTDRALHTWDARTGEVVRPPILHSAGRLATTVVDGRPVVVTTSDDGRLLVLDLRTGTSIAPPAGEPGQFTDSTFTITRIDGIAAVVASAQPTGAVVAADGEAFGEPQLGDRLFALPDARPLGPPLAEDGLEVYSRTVLTIAGRPALVSIDAAGRVRARDLVTGAAVGTPTAAHPALGLTVTVLDGTPVAVTGGSDHVVRAWNLLTGQQVGRSLVGHTAPVSMVRAVRVGDRVLLVSSTALLWRLQDTETRFWDLAAGVPVGGPLHAHDTSLTWFDAAVGGRAVLVARQPVPDGTFTVWDAAIVSGMEPG